MSLKKCPPSKILIVPRKNPEIKANQKKISFFVIKYNPINENPTEASPETNEQFVKQELEAWNQGLKFLSPPNSKISFGRDLPQKFFNNKLTKIKRLNMFDIHKNKISFFLKTKPK